MVDWIQRVYIFSLLTLASTNGTHSYYTEYENREIMFHVSTMIPKSHDEDPYLIRKQHIGNDIVVIVFLDSSETTFNPESLLSKYNHVFFVVQPVVADNGKESLRLTITRKRGCGIPEPVLQKDCVFSLEELFKRMLLSKSMLFNTI